MNVVKRSEYCEKKEEKKEVSASRKVSSIANGTTFSGHPEGFDGGVFHKCRTFAVRLAYDTGGDAKGYEFNEDCTIHDYEELNVTLVIEDC